MQRHVLLAAYENLCTLQEEALKPFVAVLRLADSPAVRQRAVQAVAAALTAHPRGLGSGACSAGFRVQVRRPVKLMF